MPHSFDQNEFRTRDYVRRRSPAADVAHAIRQAVDDQRRYFEMPQTFGAIARCDRRNRLPSHRHRIVAAVIRPACYRSDFSLVDRIARRAYRTYSSEPLLNDFVPGERRWSGKHLAEHLRRRLPDGRVARRGHHGSKRTDPIWMLNCHRLRNLAAHGRPHDMNPFEAEHVQAQRTFVGT